MPDFWQFPTVSMGLGPMMAHLPGAVHALPGESRHDRSPATARSGGFSATARWTNRSRWARSRCPCAKGSTTWCSSSTATCSGSTGRCAATARSSRNSKRLSAAPAGTSSRSSGVPAGIRCWPRITTASCGSSWKKRVDGEYQIYKATDGAYVREKFFGKHPETAEMVADMSDEEIWRLNRGGHDSARSTRPTTLRSGTRGSPRSFWPRPSRATVWARPARARTSPISRRRLDLECAARHFATASIFRLPTRIIDKVPFYQPAEDSEELEYLSRATQGAGRLPAGTTHKRTPISPYRRSSCSRRSWTAAASAKHRRRWRSSAC